MIYYVDHMGREYLGEFEQIVMLAVLRLGDEAYGVPIRSESSSAQAAPSLSAHSTPHSTGSNPKAYIHSWFADPTPQRGGRSKRYFRMLPEGVDALNRSKEMVDRMWEGYA